MDPAAKCGITDCTAGPPSSPDTSFYNRSAWIAAQERSNSCRSANSHLATGKVPTTKSGDMNNEIRFLIRNATIAPDSLLVTKGDTTTFAIGEPRKN